MIDKRFIGHQLPAFKVAVEAGRLKFFAKATGQTDPVYSDEAAACAAGYPNLLVPPTFFFCLEMESRDAEALRTRMGMDYRYLLHGEQEFTYFAMAFAGDTLCFEQRIENIYEKRNGALEFVERKTLVTNQHQAKIAQLRAITVVRHPVGVQP
jgi:acyl dehydratase